MNDAGENDLRFTVYALNRLIGSVEQFRIGFRRAFEILLKVGLVPNLPVFNQVLVATHELFKGKTKPGTREDASGKSVCGLWVLWKITIRF